MAKWVTVDLMCRAAVCLWCDDKGDLEHCSCREVCIQITSRNALYMFGQQVTAVFFFCVQFREAGSRYASAHLHTAKRKSDYKYWKRDSRDSLVIADRLVYGLHI